jgi:SAM-dependent methyltransferase
VEKIIFYDYLKKHFGAHARINKVAQRYSLRGGMSRSVDLGSGGFPRNPFCADEYYGIDILDSDLPNVRRANLLLEPIPFESNSFHFCTAYDFLEHVPRCAIRNDATILPFVNIMNEVFRILAPGGIFFHLTPVYPSPLAFSDPTHVNYMTKETMKQYFCHPQCRAGRIGYGFVGCFELLSSFSWRRNHVAQFMRVLK